MREQALEDLKQRLLLLESSKPVSTLSELAVVRCPLCGDSDDVRKQHLYIGTKELDSKEVAVYDCKKCGRSGLVTPGLLHKLGIIDLSIEEYLKSTRIKGYVKSFETEKDTSKIFYKYPMPRRQDSEKIKYLSERLQLDFSDFENIKNHKIILDFGKFLSLNNIASPAVSFDKIPLLSEYGIGFVSEDKTSVSVRIMDTERSGIDERFNIIHLYQGKRSPFMYVPPCKIDILTPYPRIAVSESSFNIICVKNYFYPEDEFNTIFGSSSRKSCARTIGRLMQLTGFTHGAIDVYADRDKDFDIHFFQDSLGRYASTFDINVYLNKTDKDFGIMPKPGEKFEYEAIRL